jgi:hypothetical protein
MITFIVFTKGTPELQDTIQSIINQTIDDWKCIIVLNNNVITQTCNKIRSLPYNITLKHNINSSSTNVGYLCNDIFPLIDTEWIGFIMSGDYISNKYIEYINNHNNNKNDIIDCILFRTIDHMINITPCDDKSLSQLSCGYCINKKVLLDGLVFKDKSNEFSIFFNDIKERGYKIVISPYIAYSKYYNAFKCNRFLKIQEKHNNEYHIQNEIQPHIIKTEKDIYIKPIKNVYYISNNPGGGSNKYIDDIIKSTQNYSIVFNNISSKSELKYIEDKVMPSDILLFQYVIFSDFVFSDIIEFKKKTNIQLIIPLHDFYFMNTDISLFYKYNNNTHYNYLFDNKLLEDIDTLLKSADIVIAPSQFVKDEFEKKYNGNNIIVSPHIDYDISHNNKYIPVITNKTIHIGIIHTLSEYKGSEYYNTLFNIKEYNGYNIVYHIYIINGTSDNKNIIINKPYNESDIYNIIRDSGFHGLLYLNKWGETYCYSISHGINSGLPIMYNNIGAFKERLPKSDKYFPNNTHETSINMSNVIPNYNNMLNYIIKYNGTGSYNPNISLRIPSLYNDIYKNKYNIVLITSKIYVSSNTLSYVRNRSIYTKDERFKHTLETINSVKKYIPDSYIIMCDNSKFSESELSILKDRVNILINTQDDKELNFWTNDSPYKGFGELCQINRMCKYIKNIPSKGLFKITGRYIINDTFDINQYSIDNIFKKNKNVTDRDYYYTCFYYISPDNISNYINTINTLFYSCNNNHSIMVKDLEVIFPEEMKHDFKVVDNLGVMQRIGVWNDTTSI